MKSGYLSENIVTTLHKAAGPDIIIAFLSNHLRYAGLMYIPGRRERGFTLIELSIVLVIIGLLVGGVLAGRDLIKASEVRATITQVEKFNTAANTFFQKYGYLPGDIPATPAAQFGFALRGPYPGQGDGNGILMGNWGNGATSYSTVTESTGENVMFWVDLSAASLIPGNFSVASSSVIPSSTITLTSSPAVGAYLPDAKLGNGNYFYAANGGGTPVSWNLFGLAAVSSIPGAGSGADEAVSVPGLTVSQAYSIDKKIDDGLPEAGNVLALYMKLGGFYWAGGSVSAGSPYIYATSGTSTTCFDNAGVSQATEQYSVEISNGSNVNCALTFKMQSGD